MTKVGIRELKNRLSRYIRLAKQGQTIVVTERGEEAARIVPPAGTQQKTQTVDDILKRLAAEGHLRLGTGKFENFKPIKAKGKPLSQIIIEDRR